MTPLDTILGLPQWILSGLANGTLIRNAAGVVRASASHPTVRPGAIVAHLREIPALESVQGASAASAVSCGLQLATLYYLKVRFDRIERELTSIASHVRELSRDVTAIREQNTEHFTAQVAGSLEHLVRFEYTSATPTALDRAHEGIIDCTGQLAHVLSGMDAEALMERTREARALLGSLELSARIELRCLMHRAAPDQDVAFVLSRHASVWRGVNARLQSRTSPTIRVPTVRQLRALATGEVASLQQFLSNGAETLAGELAIQKGLAALPPDGRDEIIRLCNTSTQVTLCKVELAA